MGLGLAYWHFKEEARPTALSPKGFSGLFTRWVGLGLEKWAWEGLGLSFLPWAFSGPAHGQIQSVPTPVVVFSI